VLKLGLKEIGYVGEIHAIVRDNILDTSEAVVLMEINLGALRKYERTGVRYKAPSKFPAVDLDLAFVVDREVTSQALTENIRQTGGDLLSDCTIFDVYEGDRIPQGKRSLGFRL